jgi:hypothetical protein
MQVRFPWRVVRIVPQTLKIGWQRHAAGRADQQITAKLEIQNIERWIVIAGVVTGQQISGRNYLLS